MRGGRSDITAEGKTDESEAALQRRMAYQEELRVQMERKKKEKEDAKAKEKAENERFEKELEAQRAKLDQEQHNELVKEGKRDRNKNYDAKPKKVDNS